MRASDIYSVPNFLTKENVLSLNRVEYNKLLNNYLNAGEKIKTIKAIRCRTGMGLKEAKVLADRAFVEGSVAEILYVAYPCTPTITRYEFTLSDDTHVSFDPANDVVRFSRIDISLENLASVLDVINNLPRC